MEVKATVEKLPGLSRPNPGPSPLLTVYTTMVSVMGLLILVVAFIRLPKDFLGLVIFAALAAIAELANVELLSGSRSRVSVSSVVGIASIMVFGPLSGALIHMVSGITTIVTTTLGSQRPKAGRVSMLRRGAFNTGMYVTATAMAGIVYSSLGGKSGLVNDFSNIAPLLAAATVDVLVNLLILIEVIALQTGKSPLAIWKENFQWAAPIAIVGNCFGGVLALAYEMFTYLGLAVFMLPILAVSYSFRIYVANSKIYVDKLEKMNKDLDEANLGLLETLGAVIDADDVYTFGHSTQVAVYAAGLAAKLGLPGEEQTRIVKAALVHDLGKVAIMDNIIRKKGQLTDEEYTLMKRHPAIGAQIISRMKGLQDLVILVRHHHERWDGRGYPDGLVGEEIPLGARILALADALDAMFSDRPYRPTRSYKEVMSEIAQCSGSQFDPMIVEKFFRMAEEKGRGFFKNSAVVVDHAMKIEGMPLLGRMDRYLKKSMLPDRDSQTKSNSL